MIYVSTKHALKKAHKTSPLGSNTAKTIQRVKIARGSKRRDWSFNERRARRLTSPWVNIEQ